jgi:dihydrofolate synthase/folylpolyglutamate synthase
MKYQDTLSYILQQLPMFQRIGHAAYRTGLDNAFKLDGYFGSPHRSFRNIHVGGTNGKGSVSHMIASILQEAGYKTGLYTSPHLVDFRERIRVNGKMITKTYITDFINNHKAFFETFDPSFFEISVFMAFEYFKTCNVDVAVVEVGLGGRLDATNIITPELSVITNIGKDHTEILGDTLEKIAAEKAGIIKKNIPVIIGESQDITLPVFRSVCQQLDAPMTIADKLFRIDYSMMSVDDYQVFNVRRNDEVYYTNLKCALLGHYQRKNVVTVLAVIEELTRLSEEQQFKIRENHIFAGVRNVIRNTALAGRWQIIRNNPLVICDTAHNADGIRVVLQQINESAYKQLHLVIGFVNDKDVHGIMKFLPIRAAYYFVRLSVPRTMDEKEMFLLAAKNGLRGKAYRGIADAYAAVMEKAGKDDLIVITGSNFLVADFLNQFPPP